MNSTFIVLHVQQDLYVSLSLLCSMLSKIYLSLPGYELYLYCTLCLVRSIYFYLYCTLCFVRSMYLPGYEIYLYCTLCLVRSMYLYPGMKSTSILLYGSVPCLQQQYLSVYRQNVGIHHNIYFLILTFLSLLLL